jgi:crotonobetaine/carnitine-CoA ligase
LSGKTIRDMEIAILDKKDTKLPHGEVGEIAFRPNKPHIVFEGYYGASEKTLETWRNLWIHTGDLGFLDQEGNLHFVRRIAESINIKGEWVDVAALEDLLRSHPSVFDCTVVGVSDPIVGNEVKACIQTTVGENIDPEEITVYCEGKIADFMIPRYIEIYKELPRLGGTEKIAKAQLQSQGVTVNTWDRKKADYTLKHT